MKSTLIAEESDPTFVLILKSGEEAFKAIAQFAKAKS